MNAKARDTRAAKGMVAKRISAMAAKLADLRTRTEDEAMAAEAEAAAAEAVADAAEAAAADAASADRGGGARRASKGATKGASKGMTKAELRVERVPAEEFIVDQERRKRLRAEADMQIAARRCELGRKVGVPQVVLEHCRLLCWSSAEVHQQALLHLPEFRCEDRHDHGLGTQV